METEDKTSDYFNRAIKELETISADFETDEATRAEANKSITALRTKRQDAALDSITSRTAFLSALTQSLQNVVDKAGHAGTSQSLSSLRGLVAEVKRFADMGKKI